MNTLLRSLIVWLLLLAVPFQGMAAASMLACAPAQPVPVPATMHPMHQMDDAQLAPCHQAALKAGTDDKGAQAAHGAAATCASCAACGIFAAVLPASFPGLACHAPPGASVASAERCPPSVHLAQPERPPRPLLA